MQLTARRSIGGKAAAHAQDLADLLGQVVHVPVALGLELDLLLEDHGAPLVSGSPTTHHPTTHCAPALSRFAEVS